MRRLLHDASTTLLTTALGGVVAAFVALWWVSVGRSRTKNGREGHREPERTATGRLQVLPASCVDEAAALAAAAFVENPTYAYVAGNTHRQDDRDARAQRQRFLEWLFARNLWLRVGTSCSRATFDGEGRLACAFMLVPPTVPDVSLGAMIAAGILAAPLRFGLGPVRRLLEVKDWYERVENDLRREYTGGGKSNGVALCHLERMCVRPDLQGQGVGTRALAEALAETDASGLGVFLATQLERNVTFYERLGFTLVKKVRDGPAAPATDYFMVRTPPGTPPSSFGRPQEEVSRANKEPERA